MPPGAAVIGARHRLVVLPGSLWSDTAALGPDEREFRSCLADARDILARFDASPDREADGRRYAAVCRRLEELALVVGEATYVTDALGRGVLPSQDRGASLTVGETVLSPDELSSVAAGPDGPEAGGTGPDAALAAFVAGIKGRGDGLAIVAEAFLGTARQDPPPSAASRSPDDDQPRGADAAEIDAPVTAAESMSAQRALHRHVDLALRRPSVRVPVGIFGDAAITRAMHRAVFRLPLQEGASIRPMYSDGSVGAPFRVACRAEPDDPTHGGEVLRVALVSIRHLELDGRVDFAWFRNRDVSVSRSYAETEERCGQTTTDQLDELRQAVAPDGKLTIHVYQTGLPQAVMGFYRGLLEALQEGRWEPSRLQVVPIFFEPWRKAEPGHSGPYWPGPVWG